MKSMFSIVRRLGAVVAAFALIAASVFAQPASADTFTVKMGTDTGMLAFEPSTITIKSGDTVKWVNNKAFPHNVVFEASAPESVQKHSHKQLAAAPGQEFVETFDGVESGTYTYYCVPHRGAGMAGKIIVE
ncbi:MAG: plastocyanin [Cyanobacteria bacterium P01_A01_bin.3]